jgi:serine/threonine protein kinase
MVATAALTIFMQSKQSKLANLLAQMPKRLLASFGGKKKSDAHKEKKTDTSSWKLTDFQQLETLGTGTFGRVFLVCHNETSKFYAMKVLRKNLVVRLKQVQHVQNEKSILLACGECPFIVKLYVECFSSVILL